MTTKTTAAPCPPITVVTGSDVIAIPPTTITQKRLTFRADVADPMADLMMRMLAGFAQFERAMIRERQKEAIAIEKAKGDVYSAPKLNAAQVAGLWARCDAGEEKAAVARSLGISRVSLYRYLKGAQPGAAQ